MPASLRLGLLVLGSAMPLAAQSSCKPDALASAAKSVAAVRHQLHMASVPESDMAVPPAIATQLGELKDALAQAADAAFACANGASTPEQLQTTLTAALHAEPAAATGTVETRGGKDYGAYGSDLGVQVFQLFGQPKFFEVDLHYGIECGDDHLLMVFEAASGNPASVWRERLRWGAPAYSTVADAFGDFVMLTPLTGSYQAPNWRFVVAHGHPGCGRGVRESRFDLDLLAPTADPAKPAVDWHFDHPYTEDRVAPRLSTTEDTVDFRLAHEGRPGKAVKTPQTAEVYRFHLTSDGHLEPAPAGEGEDAGGTPARPVTPSSPPSTSPTAPR